MTDRTTLVIPTDRFMAAVAAFSPVVTPAEGHAKQALGNRRSNTPRTVTPAALGKRPSHTTEKELTMADNSAMLQGQKKQQQQQLQQQPNIPEPGPALSPQPSPIDRPQNPLPGNPSVMPQPTPPETTPHPGL